MIKSFTTACITAATLFAGAGAAHAVPMIGAPNNGGSPTLNAFLGNFDTALVSQAGVGSITMHFAEPGLGLSANDVVAPVAINEHPSWVNAHGSSAVAGPDGILGVGSCAQGQGGPANCNFTEGAEWISFANTGMTAVDGGAVGFTVANHGNSPVATFKLDFTTGSSMANLGLWIYGDDTAEAFISGIDIDDTGAGLNGFSDGIADGRLRISPLMNPSQNTCAGGVIGCQPGEQAFVEMFWLSPNTTYTLEIDMYQIGGGPMGILFAGGLKNVPEPATMALLSLGLLGIGAVRRRRQAA